MPSKSTPASDTPSKPRPRWKRRLLSVAIAVPLALVVLIAVLYGLAQTTPAKSYITKKINELASASPDMDVEISGLTGNFPFNFNLEQVTISDREGPWLRISGIHVDLASRELPRRRIHIEEAHVDAVTVMRTPVPSEEEEPKEPFSIQRLLEQIEAAPQIRADSVTVDSIVLEEPVYGRRSEYTLSAKLTPENGTRVLEANVGTVEGPELTAAVLARLRDEGGNLDIAVEFDEGPGGFVAELARLEAADPLSASLNGEGPLSDWSGGLEVYAGDLALADVSIGLDLIEGYTADVAGTLRVPPPWIPENAGDLLSDPIEVETTFSADSALNELDLKLVAAGAGLDADIQAAYARPDDNAQLDATITADNLAPFSAFTPEPLEGAGTLEAQLSGPTTGPDGTLSVTITEFAYGETAQAGRVTLTSEIALANLDTESPTVELNGDGVVTDLDLPDRELPDGEFARIGINVQTTQDGRYVAEMPVTLPPYNANLQLAGTLTNQSELDATLTIPETDLAALNNLLGPEVAGLIQANARITGDIEAGTFNAAVEATGQSITGLPPAVQPLVSEEAQLRAELATNAEGVITVQNAAFSGGPVDVTAQATINPEAETIEASWSGDIAQLAPFSDVAGQPLEGTAETSGTLSGSFDTMRVDGTVNVQQAVLGDAQFDTIRAQVQAEGLPNAPQGNANVYAENERGVLEGNTQFASSDERFELTSLDLSAPGVTIGGAMTYGFENASLDGQFEGDAPDLETFGDFLGITMDGNAEFALTLGGTAEAPEGELTATASDVVAPGLRLASANIDATFGGTVEAPIINAEVEAEDLVTDAATVETLSFEARGEGEQFDVALSATGTEPYVFSAEAEADVAIEENTQTVTLADLSVTLDERTLNLVEPATFVRSPESMRLEPAVIAVEGGEVRARFTLAENRVDAGLTVDSLPLAVLELAGAPSLEGTLEGELTLTGAADDPNLDAQLAATGVRPVEGAIEDVPALDATLTASNNGGPVVASLQVQGLADEESTARVTVPASISVQPFEVNVDQNAPLEGSADVLANLRRLAAVTLPEEHLLRGLARADLTIAGTVNAPRVQGEIEVADGRYENITTGTILEDFSLDAALVDRQIQIASFSATDGADGSIEAEGIVDLQDGVNYEAEIRFEEATLARMEVVDATADGTLQAQGDAESGELVGELALSPVYVRIPKRTNPDVPHIQVTEVNRPVGQEPLHEDDQGDGGYTLNLDLTLNVPGEAYVQGRGLDSEWRGTVFVAGTVDDPRIRGDLNVVQGTFSFMDRDFELADSRIQLDENQPSDPLLDIRATLDTREIEAVLRVVGPASSPAITMTSQPPYPQDQVLSYVLFGRPLNQLTPAQTVQLASAMRRLSGGGNALDMLGQPLSALGLDAVDIQTDIAGGGATVGVGKALSDRFYVEFKQGVGTDGTGAAARFDITDDVVLEGDVQGEGESSVKLKYEYDY